MAWQVDHPKWTTLTPMVQVVVVYVVAIPASGIAVGADAPLVFLHTFFVAMLGLSIAWVCSKGLQLSKR